jgi:DNA helicase-2/ATP-dependent DNA helicase PcrA
MSDFTTAYKQLNKEQRQAVDNIDGPMLVLAGPGTGKTQLLSARVSNILLKTDVSPSNILCLTFTENGALNMRQRLRSMIGDDAYDVTISTYHSFGSDIIRNYSQYFQNLAVDRSDDIRMERPIDELSQIQIVDQIVRALPFDSPLLGARYYVKSVVSTISDLKQHLVTPSRLTSIASNNLQQITQAQPPLDSIINDRGGFSSKKSERFGQYAQLLEAFRGLDGNLLELATHELELAQKKSEETQSTTPLTKWKNTWLHKTDTDVFVLTDPERSIRMTELAKVYAAYERALRVRAAYDFDDMIIRAIDGLRHNDEFRYNLQERYQYILLDEFQDTNPSQFELVKCIADHPVHEGRPNIMAVGDDDQAIFAFQGANVGNMKEFIQTFRGVQIVNLRENYRSHPDVLHVAHNIAGQIEDRLHSQLDGIVKTLVASSAVLPAKSEVSRHEFLAEASEYSWISEKIATLIQNGTKASNIAVLAPKHALLENLVPFLSQHDIPLSYEKRENILETEIVQGLRLAAQLVQSLIMQDTPRINQYFPLVLSLPYWEIKASEIWQVNWKLARHDEDRTWPEIALTNKKLSRAVTFYLAISSCAASEPLELTLDKLVGSLPVLDAGGPLTAPLKEYYFSRAARANDALKYYEAVSHLSVIRSKLREHQAMQDRQLVLDDFLNFFDMYEAAEASLVNSHPVAQAADSVQLMTVYKAKGLEFDHVFIVQALDDVWGSSSRSSSNKLSLPANLQYIRYANSTDDERLRLFFVALTRAKHGLYITSHAQKDSGKATTPLKYLSESDGLSRNLPPHAQKILSSPVSLDTATKDIETLWQAGQVSLQADFGSLLAERLATYQMSPTHLNTFIDVERGGPEAFLVQTLLKFPQAPHASGEYGTAVHNTLEWYQNQLNDGRHPDNSALLARYELELNRRYMTEQDRTDALKKGSQALTMYISARHKMFTLQAKAEVNFYSEGVVLGNARLSGKIDRLEIDPKNKTVRIADYKTGTPLTKWDNSIKALKYRQQLYFYKLLIEGSTTWRDYTVLEARLEFVEPDKPQKGSIVSPLVLEFDNQTEQQLKALVAEVWKRIQALELPDIATYPKDAKGVATFIAELLSANK